MSYEMRVIIPEDHPSLPGHFPGNPVVPGVVILGEVWEALRMMEGGTIFLSGAPLLKFHTPLRPKEVLTIRFEARQNLERAFTCLTGERLVASGRLTYTIFPTPQKSDT